MALAGWRASHTSDQYLVVGGDRYLSGVLGVDTHPAVIALTEATCSGSDASHGGVSNHDKWGFDIMSCSFAFVCVKTTSRHQTGHASAYFYLCT